MQTQQSMQAFWHVTPLGTITAIVVTFNIAVAYGWSSRPNHRINGHLREQQFPIESRQFLNGVDILKSSIGAKTPQYGDSDSQSSPGNRYSKVSLMPDCMNFGASILGWWFVMAAATVGTSSLLGPSSMATSAVFAYEWDLMNGSVSLDETTTLTVPATASSDMSGGSTRTVRLTKPQLVGAGSGGAVFAFDKIKPLSNPEGKTDNLDDDLLLKISWETTGKTVQRECVTLRRLEERQVQAAERCLGSFEYPSQTSSGRRSMILVSPYMRDAVASIDEVDNPAAKKAAVDQIARTLVQMLRANIITIDVQPLISKSTGQTIFIDMTEAQEIKLPSSSSVSNTGELGFLESSLISSFATEMVALVPEAYWKTAQDAVVSELNRMQASGAPLPNVLQNVLEEQTPWLPET